MKIKKTTINNTTINTLLVIISLFFSIDHAKSFAPALLLTQALLYTNTLLKNQKFDNLLLPSSIAFFYSNLNYILGFIGYEIGIPSSDVTYSYYVNWNHTNTILTYIILCNTALMFCTTVFTDKISDSNLKKRTLDKKITITPIIYGIVIFTTFSIIPLDLSFLGASDDLSIVPKTIFALILIYNISIYNIKLKYILYISIILIYSSFSFSNKREVIFLLFPMMFFELSNKNFKISLSILSKSFATFFLTCVALLSMTILRGYESLATNNDSIYDAIKQIFTLITISNFPLLLFNIFEIKGHFFHSIQAIEYVLDDTSIMTYGSTIAKALLVIIPRSLIEKPETATALYTKIFSPDFFAIGGSLPPNLFSELFINFHFFALLVIPIVFYILNKSYIFLYSLYYFTNSYVKFFVFLFAYTYMPFYYRGSGLDLYLAYVLVSIIICIPISLTLKKMTTDT